MVWEFTTQPISIWWGWQHNECERKIPKRQETPLVTVVMCLSLDNHHDSITGLCQLGPICQSPNPQLSQIPFHPLSSNYECKILGIKILTCGFWGMHARPIESDYVFPNSCSCLLFFCIEAKLICITVPESLDIVSSTYWINFPGQEAPSCPFQTHSSPTGTYRSAVHLQSEVFCHWLL